MSGFSADDMGAGCVMLFGVKPLQCGQKQEMKTCLPFPKLLTFITLLLYQMLFPLQFRL